MSCSRIILTLKPSTVSKICGSLGALEGFFEGVGTYISDDRGFYSGEYRQVTKEGISSKKTNIIDIIAPTMIYGGLGFFGSRLTLKIANKLATSDAIKQLSRK